MAYNARISCRGFEYSALVLGTALSLFACSDEGTGEMPVTIETAATTPSQASSPSGSTIPGPMGSNPDSSNPDPIDTSPVDTSPANTGPANTGPDNAGAAGMGGTGTGGTSTGGASMGGTGGASMGGASTGGTSTGGMGGTSTGGMGGASTGGTGTGGGGTAGSPEVPGEEDLDMTAEDFSCIGEWDQVLGFRITNLLGHLDEAIAVAQSSSGGEYPVGTVIQHLPTEAMVKRREGFSPESKDWEFFILQLSADGVTTIAQRGTTEVTTGMGESCVSCHSLVPDEFDFVCNTWGDQGSANCGFNFEDSFLDTQLATDTRCE